MTQCAAPGCNNNSATINTVSAQQVDNTKITFHLFPLKHPELLVKWLANLNKPDWQPGVFSRLCSEHFEEKCFNRMTNTRLLANAVPTIFSDENVKRSQKRSSSVAQTSSTECQILSTKPSVSSESESAHSEMDTAESDDGALQIIEESPDTPEGNSPVDNPREEISQVSGEEMTISSTSIGHDKAETSQICQKLVNLCSQEVASTSLNHPGTQKIGQEVEIQQLPMTSSHTYVAQDLTANNKSLIPQSYTTVANYPGKKKTHRVTVMDSSHPLAPFVTDGASKGPATLVIKNPDGTFKAFSVEPREVVTQLEAVRLSSGRTISRGDVDHPQTIATSCPNEQEYFARYNANSIQPPSLQGFPSLPTRYPNFNSQTVPVSGHIVVPSNTLTSTSGFVCIVPAGAEVVRFPHIPQPRPTLRPAHLAPKPATSTPTVTISTYQPATPAHSIQRSVVETPTPGVPYHNLTLDVKNSEPHPCGPTRNSRLHTPNILSHKKPAAAMQTVSHVSKNNTVPHISNLTLVKQNIDSHQSAGTSLLKKTNSTSFVIRPVMNSTWFNMEKNFNSCVQNTGPVLMKRLHLNKSDHAETTGFHPNNPTCFISPDINVPTYVVVNQNMDLDSPVSINYNNSTQSAETPTAIDQTTNTSSSENVDSKVVVKPNQAVKKSTTCALMKQNTASLSEENTAASDYEIQNVDSPHVENTVAPALIKHSTKKLHENEAGMPIEISDCVSPKTLSNATNLLCNESITADGKSEFDTIVSNLNPEVSIRKVGSAPFKDTITAPVLPYTVTKLPSIVKSVCAEKKVNIVAPNQSKLIMDLGQNTPRNYSGQIDTIIESELNKSSLIDSHEPSEGRSIPVATPSVSKKVETKVNPISSSLLKSCILNSKRASAIVCDKNTKTTAAVLMKRRSVKRQVDHVKGAAQQKVKAMLPALFALGDKLYNQVGQSLIRKNNFQTKFVNIKPLLPKTATSDALNPLRMQIPTFELQMPQMSPSSGLTVTPATPLIPAQPLVECSSVKPPDLEIFSIPSSQLTVTVEKPSEVATTSSAPESTLQPAALSHTKIARIAKNLSMQNNFHKYDRPRQQSILQNILGGQVVVKQQQAPSTYHHQQQQQMPSTSQQQHQVPSTSQPQQVPSTSQPQQVSQVGRKSPEIKESKHMQRVLHEAMLKQSWKRAPSPPRMTHRSNEGPGVVKTSKTRIEFENRLLSILNQAMAITADMPPRYSSRPPTNKVNTNFKTVPADRAESERLRAVIEKLKNAEKKSEGKMPEKVKPVSDKVKKCESIKAKKSEIKLVSDTIVDKEMETQVLTPQTCEPSHNNTTDSENDFFKPLAFNNSSTQNCLNFSPECEDQTTSDLQTPCQDDYPQLVEWTLDQTLLKPKLEVCDDEIDICYNDLPAFEEVDIVEDNPAEPLVDQLREIVKSPAKVTSQKTLSETVGGLESQEFDSLQVPNVSNSLSSPSVIATSASLSDELSSTEKQIVFTPISKSTDFTEGPAVEQSDVTSNFKVDLKSDDCSLIVKQNILRPSSTKVVTLSINDSVNDGSLKRTRNTAKRSHPRQLKNPRMEMRVLLERINCPPTVFLGDLPPHLLHLASESSRGPQATAQVKKSPKPVETSPSRISQTRAESKVSPNQSGNSPHKLSDPILPQIEKQNLEMSPEFSRIPIQLQMLGPCITIVPKLGPKHTLTRVHTFSNPQEVESSRAAKSNAPTSSADTVKTVSVETTQTLPADETSPTQLESSSTTKPAASMSEAKTIVVECCSAPVSQNEVRPTEDSGNETPCSPETNLADNKTKPAAAVQLISEPKTGTGTKNQMEKLKPLETTTIPETLAPQSQAQTLKTLNKHLNGSVSHNQDNTIETAPETSAPQSKVKCSEKRLESPSSTTDSHDETRSQFVESKNATGSDYQLKKSSKCLVSTDTPQVGPQSQKRLSKRLEIKIESATAASQNKTKAMKIIEISETEVKTKSSKLLEVQHTKSVENVEAKRPAEVTKNLSASGEPLRSLRSRDVQNKLKSNKRDNISSSPEPQVETKSCKRQKTSESPEPSNRISSLRSSARLRDSDQTRKNMNKSTKGNTPKPETKTFAHSSASIPEASDTETSAPENQMKVLDRSSELLHSLTKLFKTSKPTTPPPPPTPPPRTPSPDIQPDPTENLMEEMPVYIVKRSTNHGFDLKKAYMENRVDPDKIPASALVSRNRRGRRKKKMEMPESTNSNIDTIVENNPQQSENVNDVFTLLKSNEVEIKRTKLKSSHENKTAEPDGFLKSNKEANSNLNSLTHLPKICGKPELCSLLLDKSITIVPIGSKSSASLTASTNSDNDEDLINSDQHQGHTINLKEKKKRGRKRKIKVPEANSSLRVPQNKRCASVQSCIPETQPSEEEKSKSDKQNVPSEIPVKKKRGRKQKVKIVSEVRETAVSQEIPEEESEENVHVKKKRDNKSKFRVDCVEVPPSAGVPSPRKPGESEEAMWTPYLDSSDIKITEVMSLHEVPPELLCDLNEPPEQLANNGADTSKSCKSTVPIVGVTEEEQKNSCVTRMPGFDGDTQVQNIFNRLLQRVSAYKSNISKQQPTVSSSDDCRHISDDALHNNTPSQDDFKIETMSQDDLEPAKPEETEEDLKTKSGDDLEPLENHSTGEEAVQIAKPATCAETSPGSQNSTDNLNCKTSESIAQVVIPSTSRDSQSVMNPISDSPTKVLQPAHDEKFDEEVSTSEKRNSCAEMSPDAKKPKLFSREDTPQKIIFLPPTEIEKNMRREQFDNFEACDHLALSLLLRGRHNKKNFSIHNTGKHVEFRCQDEDKSWTNVCMLPVLSCQGSLLISEYINYCLQVYNKFPLADRTIFVIYTNMELDMGDEILGIPLHQIVFSSVTISMPEVPVNPVRKLMDEKLTQKMVEHLNVSKTMTLKFVDSFLIATNEPSIEGLKTVVDASVCKSFNCAPSEASSIRSKLLTYIFRTWSGECAVDNKKFDPVIQFMNHQISEPMNTASKVVLCPHLFGRESELELLEVNTRVPVTQNVVDVAVTGPPGIGKTQLVLKYTHQTSQFDHILWINAESAEVLEEQFCLLALDVKLIDGTGVHDINQIVDSVYKLFEHFRCLFVFDNVQSLPVLLDFLPNTRSPSHSFVLTSRCVEWSAGVRIELGELDHKECVTFLSSMLHGDAEGVAKLLEHFPLALQSAVSYICQKNSKFPTPFTLSDFLSELETNFHNFINFKSDCKSLTENWNEILTLLPTFPTGSVCFKLLDILAHLHVANISTQLFYKLTESYENVEAALKLMQRQSMLRVENNMIKMSHLFQQVLRWNSSSKVQTLEFLLKTFTVDLTNGNLSIIPHAIEVCSLSSKFPNTLGKMCKTLFQLLLSTDMTPTQYEHFYTKYHSFVLQYHTHEEYIQFQAKWVQILYKQKKFCEIINVSKETCSSTSNQTNSDVLNISLLTAKSFYQLNNHQAAWELLNSIYTTNKTTSSVDYNEWEIISLMCNVACHLHTPESLRTCRLLLATKTVCDTSSFELTSMFTRQFAQLLIQQHKSEEVLKLYNEINLITKRLDCNKNQNKYKLVVFKLDYAVVLHQMKIVDVSWTIVSSLSENLHDISDIVLRENVLHAMFEVCCSKFVVSGVCDELDTMKQLLLTTVTNQDFKRVLIKLIDENMCSKPMELFKLYDQVCQSSSHSDVLYISLFKALSLRRLNQLEEAFDNCYKIVLATQDKVNELFLKTLRLCCEIACELDVTDVSDPLSICCDLIESGICNTKCAELIISSYLIILNHLTCLKKNKKVVQFQNCIECAITSNFEKRQQKKLLALLG